MVAPIEVDNPLALSGETEKIIAIRSIRTDPLAWLHAHRHIDDAQFYAGRYWQELHQRAGLGNIQSVDTTKEPVDGGGVRDLVSDGQMDAIKKLRVASVHLGVIGERLVQDVLVHGMSIGQVAASRGDITAAGPKLWGLMFRKNLEVLATAFGFASRAQEKA